LAVFGKLFYPGLNEDKLFNTKMNIKGLSDMVVKDFSSLKI
jgi:hypothetical protein